MPATHHIPGHGLALGALAHSVETAVLYILGFAVVFGVLAFAHEFGHFLTAKMLGMSVDQFGIGFPPTHGWTLFRRSGTSYTIHPVPLGAFVRIRGMEPGDQDAPNSFLRQPPWARLIVLGAGSAGNMVLAVLIFVLMGVTTGIPQREYVTNRVNAVVKGSAAQMAGVRPGDTVLRIRPANRPDAWTQPAVVPHSPPDASAMVDLIHQSWSEERVGHELVPVGKPLVVEVRHPDGHVEQIRATPRVPSDLKAKDRVALLGYQPVPATEYKHLNGIQAAGEGIDQARSRALDLVKGLEGLLIDLVGRKITAAQFGSNFGGPAMIAEASGRAIRSGWADFLGFMGMLSINLGVLNLLPLPVFDGGNIIQVLVEVIRRKQLDHAQFMLVQIVGLVLIGCIFAYLTYNDILRLAHPNLMP